MFGTTKPKPAIPAPGSLTWPFRLGDRVRDTINGLEGVATSRFYHMTGCDRFHIELDAKDGKPGESYGCDAGRLELVTAFPDRHRNEVPDAYDIHLGDKVRDIGSGIAGRVGIIHVPLYGSIQFDIAPDWDAKERKMPEGYFVDGAFVEVIEAYTPKPKPAAPKAEPAAPKRTAERGCSRMSSGGLNLR